MISEKGNNYIFAEENYLNYTKKTKFIVTMTYSLKQKGNKDRQWTHLWPLKHSRPFPSSPSAVRSSRYICALRSTTWIIRVTPQNPCTGSLPGGGYLVQKTLRGCAANMGSKISLLVYEWPLIKCKIWYMNGLIFKKFRNLSRFWKIGWFCSNLAKNWTDWYMNGSLFLEKFVFVWVYFQIPWRHIPTKTKLEYPPGGSLLKILD